MAEQPFPGVIGFATPAMVGLDERGRILNAFTDPEDVRRIEAGYGCGDCCAIFDSFQLECPICHSPTNVNGQRQSTPSDWQAHADQRNYGTETTVARSPMEFLRDVRRDPEIEQIPLSKLHPSKFGRGRPA